MSDASTIRMIERYKQDATTPGFLSGFFQSPPKNFHTSKKVEIDILREDEDIAVVIQDLTVGGRHNESTRFTNKSFEPPIFDEIGTITSYDTIERRAGQDPFQDPDYGANAMDEAFDIIRKLERKIRRAVEVMSSQVFQTGILTLTDDVGATLYSLDFSPKATHHVTVGTVWAADGSTGDPLGDLEDLGRVVLKDGKVQPTRLIFGSLAWRRFMANSDVKERFRNDGLKGSMGELAPVARGNGAKFMGRILANSFEFELWLYEAFFKNPQTGNLDPYVTTDKIIMNGDGRMDLTHGAIPRPFGADPRAMPFMPSRISDSELGLDISTNAWITPNGRHMMVEAGARPLTIPTAIDTYGTLDINP